VKRDEAPDLAEVCFRALGDEKLSHAGGEGP
jgi:hypothetical protein